MESKRFFVFFLALLDPQLLRGPALVPWAFAPPLGKWFRLKPRTFSLDEGQFLGHPRTSIPSLEEGTQFLLEATPNAYSDWWFERVNAKFWTLRKWASSPRIAALSCHTINQQHPAIISWYWQISHRFRSFNPSNWLARLFKNTLTLNNSIFQSPEIKFYPETGRLKWITIDFCLWKNASVLFGWMSMSLGQVAMSRKGGTPPSKIPSKTGLFFSRKLCPLDFGEWFLKQRTKRDCAR